MIIEAKIFTYEIKFMTFKCNLNKFYEFPLSIIIAS